MVKVSPWGPAGLWAQGQCLPRGIMFLVLTAWSSLALLELGYCQLLFSGPQERPPLAQPQ